MTQPWIKESAAAVEAVEAAEYGGRRPEGWPRLLLLWVAVAWSLYQIWVASPLPFTFGFGVFNDTEVRSIHLAFAVFLSFLAFPPRRHAISHHIPWMDWLLALTAAFCAAYLFLFYEALSDRAGDPGAWDVIIASVGVLLLLEATRRALGWPLTIIAGVFLAYGFAGPWLPDLLAHKGVSLSRMASHQWLSTEGVFGVAVGVSAGFVFLFVLFGSMLERAGGGNYFIRVAFSLVGHMRGGPAKAGVLASGLTGMISGSSIANVVTTGTFTIPLMKKVGFPAYKAGAIEVAASTNGQIMPPVMGAAAFLMMEYLNLSYLEVIRHAFLPALLSYITLMYLVHLEALKAGMKGHVRVDRPPMRRRLLGWGLTLAGLVVFVQLLILLMQGLDFILGDAAVYAGGLLIVIVYLVLLRMERDSADITRLPVDLKHLPRPAEALRGGQHFLLPIAVLVWCLMELRLSPATSVFYAVLLMAVILVSQHALRAWMRREDVAAGLRRGLTDLIAALAEGARNMVGIGVATATAGIVVGTVSLTGIGQVLGELIEVLSLGSVLLMLLLTALVCMILGMGLPTTANYIVVSTLMAPVIVQLSASHGLEIPLLAVHMFVFYFGILADDTPPVGLAAYAASGISGADPIRTGVQSFLYDIRTALLPFMFVFNTELLLIGVDSVMHFLWVFVTALGAMLLFASATQGWFIRRNRPWEGVLLLVAAFSLFRPDFWRDMAFPAYELRPAVELGQTVAAMGEGERLRLMVEVEDDSGALRQRTLSLPLPPGPPAERLSNLGFVTEPAGSRLLIRDIGFMSPAEQAGLEPGLARSITGFQVRLPQPAKEWFLLPVALLVGLLAWRQWRDVAGP